MKEHNLPDRQTALSQAEGILREARSGENAIQEGKKLRQEIPEHFGNITRALGTVGIARESVKDISYEFTKLGGKFRFSFPDNSIKIIWTEEVGRDSIRSEYQLSEDGNAYFHRRVLHNPEGQPQHVVGITQDDEASLHGDLVKNPDMLKLNIEEITDKLTSAIYHPGDNPVFKEPEKRTLLSRILLRNK